MTKRSRAIRRGQLIAPFGPGAMVVTPDGTSLIGAGLDHWFSAGPGERIKIDPEEFRFKEWRLERELDVDYFCLPPDFRENRSAGWKSPASEGVNYWLTVPFLRFPQWHVCPRCQTLERFPLELREAPRCHACSERASGSQRRRPPVMTQVRFVAMCDRGHIQDFPWREWVHRSIKPACVQPMKLFAFGTASLSGIRVACECGESRSLDGITDADSFAPSRESDDDTSAEPSTYLSRNLAPNEAYLCQGRRPWLADERGEGCGRPLWGTLRGATNVHFSHVKSAIFVPRGTSRVSSRLVELFESAPLWGLISLLRDLGQAVEPRVLRGRHTALLEPFSDDELAAGIDLVLRDRAPDDLVHQSGDDREIAFRRSEFPILKSRRNDEQLLTNPMNIGDYGQEIARYFDSVTLVPKLRETRALTGFTRVFPENAQPLEERKALLRGFPHVAPDRWLPAYCVHGEGIFLELSEEKLRTWETGADVSARAGRLAKRYGIVQARRGLRAREITARFLLLHTLAHILLNELTFESGYGTASLRERLYCSDNPDAPMAGILVYTAAGDAEGTLGGLVRMGNPGSLDDVLRSALAKAKWCSTDPVCMELGSSGGQGPDSCNLAACHNCALVPETSCEEFNRFLDRGLLVGTIDQPLLGFFSDTVS